MKINYIQYVKFLLSLFINFVLNSFRSILDKVNFFHSFLVVIIQFYVLKIII